MEKFTQDELESFIRRAAAAHEDNSGGAGRVGDGTRRNLAEDRRGFRRPRTEQTVYRTSLFNSPEQLRRFCKSPDEMEKTLTLPAASPSVTARAKTKRAAR
jgi:hypothetical protein